MFHRVVPSRAQAVLATLLALCLCETGSALTFTGKTVSFTIPDTVFDVTAYGGKGDGITDDTTAIQTTIAAAGAAGGGTVLFKSGKTFISRCITISGLSNISLEIQSNSVLRLSSKKSAITNNMLIVESAKNIAITGEGTWDGQGILWWSNTTAFRPYMLYTRRTTNMIISGITIKNCPNHCLRAGANYGEMYGVTILNPPSSTIAVANRSHNTDGINLHGWYWYIHDCYISTGDDNVAVLASHALIEDCYFGYGHGAAIGSLLDDVVTNVTFNNIVMNLTDRGPRIKTKIGGAGSCSNIKFTNMVLYGMKKMSIELTMFYESTSTAATTFKISNITYQNITSYNSASAGQFLCDSNSPCNNIYMKGVTHSPSTSLSYSCSNIKSSSATGSLSPKPCWNYSTVCSPSKSCGTQKCGAFYDGCNTISCGNCSSSQYCDGTKCLANPSTEEVSSDEAGSQSVAVLTSTQWTQVLPDENTAGNWLISSTALVLKNFTQPTSQHVIKYVGPQAGWFTSTSTTATVMITAKEGQVGLGVRLGQSGTNYQLDRLSWVLTLKSNGQLADAKFCKTYKGTEKCSSGTKNVNFLPSGQNNLTMTVEIGTKYINSNAYLNSNLLATKSMTDYVSRYSSSGNAFVIAMGTSAKNFSQLIVRSKTTVHVTLTKCMSLSAWNSFVSTLLGIASSNVTTRTLGTDAMCSSRKRSEAVYNAFEVVFADDIVTSTPSPLMAELFVSASTIDGAADYAGVSVEQMEIAEQISPGLIIDPIGVSGGLSTAAIAGISAGSAVAGISICSAAAAGAVMIARRKRQEETAQPTQRPVRKSFIKMFVRGGVNMETTGAHGSITNRAPPVAQ